MKQEIDNNAMWAAFRQELALQGELHVIAAIDNALNNLGFTIKETSTIIPIPLEQGKHANFRNKIQIGDKVTRNKDGVLINLSQLNRVAKKQGEQKPAEWSEEDEMILSDIIKDLVHPWNEYIPYRIEDEIKWLKNKLKTIKDRVQSQPKQEWSEEDEKLTNRIEGWLDTLCDYLKDSSPECIEDVKEIIEQLKSLRYRSQWKPSDEQMHYLSWIANVKLGNSVVEQEVSKHLNELLEDLKKLTE